MWRNMGGWLSVKETRAEEYFSMSKKHYIGGLQNIQLSCCVNALLQTFSATPQLLDVLDRWTWSEEGGLGEGDNVAVQLQRTLKAMREEPSLTTHRDFLKCLHRNNICGAVQHDAGEVFVLILNLIRTHMTDKELAQRVLQLYQLTLENCVQCLHCGKVFSETCTSLSLPVDLQAGENMLEEQIASFFGHQRLTNGDRWYCKQCCERQECQQGIKIISLPQVLCIHLKRCQSYGGNVRKLNCAVHFLETLDFEKILHPDQISQQSTEAQWQYELYAMVAHTGYALCGHYTAYIHHRHSGKWYHADDCKVQEVSWEDVKYTCGKDRRETAYLLMFTRIERHSPAGQHNE